MVNGDCFDLNVMEKNCLILCTMIAERKWHLNVSSRFFEV